MTRTATANQARRHASGRFRTAHGDGAAEKPALDGAAAPRYGRLHPGLRIDRERAFEPFFTTKGVGEGSGLGLNMVHGLAKRSGGTVLIESDEGRGTTVRLLIPAAPEAPEHTGRTTAETLPTAVIEKELILVVEDDEEVRRVVVGSLESLGYACLEARDADAALTLIEQRDDISLLFTDIVLPGELSGAKLVRRARRLSPGLATLMTSGYPIEELPTLDEQDLLLHKPYLHQSLARAVREALGRKRPRRQRQA
ncbi:MAG: response regulator [Myxococcales bacterium]|nr:response regulator [Myxococcales bacterium]